MTSPRLRTVLVGFGMAADGLGEDPRMARHFRYASHAQVLAAHPDFDWRAVVDPAPGARDRARAKWDVPEVVPAIDALAPGLDAEVAVIATPPGARADVVARLPGLKAVLVEKPLGATLAEARSFLELCRQRGIAVQVNYWRRAAEGFRALAEGGLAARVGRPQAAFAVYGNGLLNNGSHLVDFARMLFGEVVSAEAVGSAAPAPGSPVPGDVDAGFVLGLANGARLMAQPLDFRRYREVSLDVWGERGRVSILQEGLSALAYPLAPNRGLEDAAEIASDEGAALDCPVGSAFYDMYTNLAAAVHEGAGLWSPGDSALATELVVHRIAEAATSAVPAGRKAAAV